MGSGTISPTGVERLRSNALPMQLDDPRSVQRGVLAPSRHQRPAFAPQAGTRMGPLRVQESTGEAIGHQRRCSDQIQSETLISSGARKGMHLPVHE